MRPLAIDLFSGAGGFSLGFEQAGFDVVAAVELDPIHCATHAFNFPTTAVICKSIAHTTGAEIRRRSGIGSRKVHVVVGGAPCQGFSMIGHRALEDPRNALVREFVRIVSELEARYFVFENVKGLTVGKHRQFLEELIEAFREVGYWIKLPWRVLNAAHYGVPQNRERLILFGARNGLRLPDYPAPTTRPVAAVGTAANLPDGPTCGEALGDLPEVDDFSELVDADCVRTTRWGDPTPYARRLRCLDNDAWGYGYLRDWDPLVLTSSMRTDHTEISRRRFRETAGGETEPISRFFKLPRDGICNTLRAGTDSSRGAFTSPRPIHYETPRCVTVREMARLHGFPDWFRFHTTKWHGARQIGNAVPPILARAIGAQIVAALDLRPSRPNRVLQLGDSTLLSMDMADASKHWGVSVPIRRRDRKSGAKKRKQDQIEAQRLLEAAD